VLASPQEVLDLPGQGSSRFSAMLAGTYTQISLPTSLDSRAGANFGTLGP
jgi:hypothetical protein